MGSAVYTGHGERVARFAETYIRQTKGRWAGKPLHLEDWQRELLDELYLVDGRGRRVYREALIGVPRKNGKSTLAATIALAGLLVENEPGAEVYAAAASKEQARIVFNQARDFVQASPLLQDWLRPMRNVIVCEETGGVFRVLSSDAPLQHGLNPSLVVIDELHAHRDPELYFALTTGQLARENPLVVSITTAGFDLESICRQVYEHGQGLELEGLDAMRREQFLFRWWTAPDGCDITDPAAWAAANPSSWIDPADLARESRRLPESVFRRLHLNQWTAAEDTFLPHGAWERLAIPGLDLPTDDRPVHAGVDVAFKYDASAVTCVWIDDDGRACWKRTGLWEPRGDGSLMDLAPVENHIRELGTRVRLRSVPYDKYGFQRSAEMLLNEGLPMVEIPWTNERIAPTTERIYQAVMEGRIAHDGDPVLAQHARAVGVVDTERGRRIAKRKAKQRMDAFAAGLMAFMEADQQQPRPGAEW